MAWRHSLQTTLLLWELDELAFRDGRVPTSRCGIHGAHLSNLDD